MPNVIKFIKKYCPKLIYMILTNKAQATKIQYYSAYKTSFSDKLSKNKMQIIFGDKDYTKTKGLQIY